MHTTLCDGSCTEGDVIASLLQSHDAFQSLTNELEKVTGEGFVFCTVPNGSRIFIQSAALVYDCNPVVCLDKAILNDPDDAPFHIDSELYSGACVVIAWDVHSILNDDDLNNVIQFVQQRNCRILAIASIVNPINSTTYTLKDGTTIPVVCAIRTTS